MQVVIQFSFHKLCTVTLIVKIKLYSTCFTGLMSKPIAACKSVYISWEMASFIEAILNLWRLFKAHLFSSSDISACSLRCHFSAWLNTCLRRRTLVCTALMSSDSTSPLTTAHRPSNMSVTSSRVYVSSTSLCNKDMSIKLLQLKLS